jgi:hypothetical protein
MTVATWDAGTDSWVTVARADQRPEQPLGMARNDVGFEAVRTSRVRVLLEHPLPDVSGVTEIVVLGPADPTR